MRALFALLAFAALAAGLVVFLRSEQGGPGAVGTPDARGDSGSSRSELLDPEPLDDPLPGSTRAADESAEAQAGMQAHEDEALDTAESEAQLAALLRLRIRVLREDSTPVALETVELRLVTEGRTWAHVEITDDDGVLRVSLPEEWREDESVSVIASLVVESANPSAARPMGRTVTGPLERGENDLGELILLGPSLIAGGQIVDAAGVAIGGARVELVVVDRHSASRAILRTRSARDIEPHVTQADANGAFLLNGQPLLLDGDVEYALLASSRAHLESEPVPFEVGQDDLWIPLASAGWIEGSFEVSREGPRPRHTFLVTVEARRAGQGEISAEVRARAPGAFELGGLAVGDYDLSFRYEDPFPALVVEDVAVFAGAGTQDERLDPVRLGANTFELRILNEAGEDVAEGVVIRRRPSGTSEWPSVAGASRSGNTYKLTTTAERLDLRVEAEGYEPLEVEGVDGDRTLTLRRAPSLRVSVPAFVFGVLEPGDELILSLVHHRADGLPPRAVLTAEEPAADVGITGAFKYRLKLSLRRRLDRSRTTMSPLSARAFEPRSFDASTAGFERYLDLELDVEELRKLSESMPRGD